MPRRFVDLLPVGDDHFSIACLARACHYAMGAGGFLLKSGLALLLLLCAGVLHADAPPQYQKACAICHQEGRFGAPRAHVPGDWQARLAKGADVLVQHVKDGYNAMPAGGMCGSCSDQDYRSLIEFMSTQKKDKP